MRNFKISLQKIKTNEDSNARYEEQKALIRHSENKKHSNRSKSLLISNSFKCKLVKFSNQKTEIGRMNRNS